MLTYLRRHHLGLIALFFALTGTSYAVATGSIDSREIRNNAVRSKDVRNNTLSGADVRNNTLRSRDVRDSALIGADVLDASLNGGDLANGTVEGLDVRDGTLRDPDIGPNSVSNDELTGGSVRSGEVQNGSLAAEDLQAGLLVSDAGVRFDSFAVASTATGAGTVSCPAGQRALGGGVSFATNDPDDRVTFSEPRAGNATPGTQGAAASGWAGGILNGGAAERTATVWAICAAR
jgi:hypothetical protein